jgi:hypothetical protein
VVDTTKDISEMTHDELNALPVFEQWYFVEVNEVRYPRARGRLAFHMGPNTPMCWEDADAVLWVPVYTADGWMKERA